MRRQQVRAKSYRFRAKGSIYSVILVMKVAMRLHMIS